MKNLFSLLSLIAFFSISSFGQADCFVPEPSEWGLRCPECRIYNGQGQKVYDDTYTVHMKNTCNFEADFKMCVQERTKQWKCYEFDNVKPEEVVSGYACQGTGKKYTWQRKSSDRSVVFPTDKEVDRMFQN